MLKTIDEEDETKQAESKFICILYYTCRSEETDYSKGDSGIVSSAWGDKDIPPTKNRFSSVKEALAHILEINGFSSLKNDWSSDYWDGSGYDTGLFECYPLVDVNNMEASEEDVEAWKRGEKRLWQCAVRAHLAVRTERSLLPDEIKAIN